LAIGSGQLPMKPAIGSGQLPMRPRMGSGQLPMPAREGPEWLCALPDEGRGQREAASIEAWVDMTCSP
jgi:hypothetical protein